MCSPVPPQLFYSNYVPRKKWRLSVASNKLSLTMSYITYKSMWKKNKQNEKYIFIRTQIAKIQMWKNLNAIVELREFQIEIIILIFKYWAFILIFYHH